MAKMDPSGSPDSGVSFDAQRTHVEEPTRSASDEPTRLVDSGPPAKRAARDLDDNWALSASMSVPRVTGVTDAMSDPAHDPEGPTVPAPGPSPEAPTVAATARKPLSRAELRLLGGKTIQGVAPVTGQRRSAMAESTGAEPRSEVSATSLRDQSDVRFSRPGAPMYLDDRPGVLRMSTDTSEVSVPEIDAGTSATTLLPSKRAPSPYHDPEPYRDPHDDSGIGELAEPPPPVAPPALQSDTLDQELPPEVVPAPGSPGMSPPHFGHALAGAPPPALKGPTAVAPAIALASRRSHPGELVGESSQRSERDWFEPSGGVPIPAHPDHSFTGGARKASRLTLPLLVFAALSAVVFAGAYVYSRGRATPAPAPATASVASPAAPEALAASAGLVDIRFDSTPPGANVVLVDREHESTSVVGTTPVRVAIDSRGKYDAIFTLSGHSPRLLAVSPSAPHVVADFSIDDPAAVSAARAASPTVTAGLPASPPATPAADPSGAPAADPSATPAANPSGSPTATTPPSETPGTPVAASEPPKPEVIKDKTGKRPGKRPRGKGAPSVDEEEDDRPVRNVDPSALGRLTISTKPPCQVLINGKAHGTTPLRELELPAGIYKITVINKEIAISETIAVRVTAGKETKFVQDYTSSGATEP